MKSFEKRIDKLTKTLEKRIKSADDESLRHLLRVYNALLKGYYLYQRSKAYDSQYILKSEFNKLVEDVLKLNKEFLLSGINVISREVAVELGVDEVRISMIVDRVVRRMLNELGEKMIRLVEDERSQASDS